MLKIEFILQQEQGQKGDGGCVVWKISNLVYFAKQMFQIKMIPS